MSVEKGIMWQWNVLDGLKKKNGSQNAYVHHTAAIRFFFSLDFGVMNDSKDNLNLSRILPAIFRGPKLNKSMFI